MVALNDLYDYGLKIYQDDDYFKFSLDSLLLSELVEVKEKDKNILDICTGNAPIPLVLGYKYPNTNIIGVEIEEKIASLAETSVNYNKLTNIKILNMNALELTNYFPGNNFNIITCNPPYFKVSEESLINKNKIKAVARHEITITLEEIIELSSKLLVNEGKLYLVHRPERIEEIINVASKYNLHVKEIHFVYTKLEECAIMVLLKFVKNSNFGTKIYSKVINRETKTYKDIFKRG